MRKIKQKKLKSSRKFQARTQANIKILQKSFAKRDAQGKHVVRDNMPCLCQYFATELGLRVGDSLNVTDNDANEEGGLSKEASSGEVTASELAASKAEILSLKGNLTKAEISADNMEVLMKIMIEKQNYLMSEVFELKKMNEDLRLQQITDRNNQSLERGVLLKELHEIKILLRDRSNIVEKTLQQNCALTHALKDANEKIYAMGMKFLKLKNNRTSTRDGSDNSPSSDEASYTDGSVSTDSHSVNSGS